jgi:hypothetical protein
MSLLENLDGMIPRPPILDRYKAESGLAQRIDIATMMDYFDVDEGRKS